MESKRSLPKPVLINKIFNILERIDTVEVEIKEEEKSIEKRRRQKEEEEAFEEFWGEVVEDDENNIVVEKDENNIKDDELTKKLNQLKKTLDPLLKEISFFKDGFPLENLWLLFIDERYHALNDPYTFDKGRGEGEVEIGYYTVMRKVLLTVLATLDKPLTWEEIINLQKMAVENIEYITRKGGVIPDSEFKGVKTQPNQGEFEFCLSTTTSKGIDEIINNYADFVSIGRSEDSKDVYRLSKTLPYLLWNSSHTTPLGIFDEIEERRNLYRRKDSPELMTDYQRKAEKLACSFLTEYHERVRVDSPLGQLKAIVEFLHKMNLLHIFHDGNIRTLIFAVGSKLFIQNGYPPAIYHNPNCFDGHSCDELVDLTIAGMEKFVKLFPDKNTRKFSDLKEEQQRPEAKKILLGR